MGRRRGKKSGLEWSERGDNIATIEVRFSMTNQGGLRGSGRKLITGAQQAKFPAQLILTRGLSSGGILSLLTERKERGKITGSSFHNLKVSSRNFSV